jgi:predicted SprT family Zn-dependent metalloprotease
VNYQQVSLKAFELMRKYGLWGWEFGFSKRKRAVGDCHYGKKKIRFSLNYMWLSPKEKLDTILHEIAHALDWIRNRNWGHSKSWKKICVEIGARPERFMKTDERPPRRKTYQPIFEAVNFWGFEFHWNHFSSDDSFEEMHNKYKVVKKKIKRKVSRVKQAAQMCFCF